MASPSWGIRKLLAYGLLQPATQAPAAPSNLTATAVSGSVVSLTWQDRDTAPNLATGCDVEESTDSGKTFTPIAIAGAGATAFTVQGLTPSTPYAFQVVAFNDRGNSPSNTANVTTLAAPTILDFSGGFASSTNLLTYNLPARINGSAAELTDGGLNEAGSVFSTNLIDVTQFTNQFTFRLSSGARTADGFTFTLQGVGPTALGSPGQGLGYSETSSIGNSVAIEFNLFSIPGVGASSTNLATDGQAPTTPASNLLSRGINLHSGDLFRVVMSYDGTNLNVVLTDTWTKQTADQSYALDVPKVVGSDVAYAGFTGGTGSQTAVQNILTWKYDPTTVTPALPAPTGLKATVITGTQVELTWTNNATAETGFEIERSTSSTFPKNHLVTQTGTSANGFGDGSLIPGTTYYYRVCALNGGTPGPFSSTVKVKLPKLPAAPTHLQATRVTSTAADLSWINHATNASNVQIFREKGKDAVQAVALLGPDANSFSDTGLKPGIPYTYTLEAANLAGPSALAEFTIATPVTDPPGSVSAAVKSRHPLNEGLAE